VTLPSDDAAPPRLCIFARVPIHGRVKTRLAATLGAGAALAAHVALVEDTLQRLGRLAGVVTELWLDDVPDTLSRSWASRFGLEIRRQRGDDLGDRMHEALLDGMAAAGRAVVVGTDCPLIDAGYAAAAFAALESADVVLGPAEDGGYGLVGLRRPAPELFRDMPWGLSVVLQATLQAAAAAGLSVERLPETWDVDTADAWLRYQRLRGRA
jgi:uncharacterized protein